MWTPILFSYHSQVRQLSLDRFCLYIHLESILSCEYIAAMLLSQPQLPGHMQVRLQMCQNWQPKDVTHDGSQLDSDTLQKWLKRLQFKLGQIEVQSSAATQFYTVWGCGSFAAHFIIMFQAPGKWSLYII